MKVRVHWNLTRGGFVVRGVPKRKGDLRYADSVCVKDARFVVSIKGRDYCRAKQARWVHAWVEGELCDCGRHDGVDVTYDPFRDEGFVVRGTSRGVTTAEHVSMRTRGDKPDTRARRV